MIPFYAKFFLRTQLPVHFSRYNVLWTNDTKQEWLTHKVSTWKLPESRAFTMCRVKSRNVAQGDFQREYSTASVPVLTEVVGLGSIVFPPRVLVRLRISCDTICFSFELHYYHAKESQKLYVHFRPQYHYNLLDRTHAPRCVPFKAKNAT